MAAAVILDIWIFEILTVWTVSIVELRRRAKFHRNRSNRGPDRAIFRFFKMAAAVILDFQNMQILGQEGSRRPNTLLGQISRRLVKPLLRYGDFSILKHGGRRHLGFLNFWKFNGRNGEERRTS